MNFAPRMDRVKGQLAEKNSGLLPFGRDCFFSSYRTIGETSWGAQMIVTDKMHMHPTISQTSALIGLHAVTVKGH